MTIEKTFDLAVKNHKKNNFQVAENLYKEVLKINGDYWSSDTPRSEMGYGKRTSNIAYSFDFSSDLDERLYKQSGLNNYANAPIERNSYKVVICVN